MAAPDARAKLIQAAYEFAASSPSRMPLSDLYYTDSSAFAQNERKSEKMLTCGGRQSVDVCGASCGRWSVCTAAAAS
jgi:hypothetical protein